MATSFFGYARMDNRTKLSSVSVLCTTLLSTNVYEIEVILDKNSLSLVTRFFFRGNERKYFTKFQACMICKINSTIEKLNSSNSNIFFKAYTLPDILLIELVYMIETWLVVSIFASIFLEMFANVEFRNSLWSILGFDALGLKPNGDEFLWICKNG